MAGLVIEARHRNTPRGPMGSMVLDDRTGRIEVTAFSELYQECRDMLSVDKVVVVSGSLSYDEFRGGLSVRADRVMEFAQARENFADLLRISVDAKKVPPTGLVAQLKALLEPVRGGACGVSIEYLGAGSSGNLRLGPDWQVRPTDSLIKHLRELFGPASVRVMYRRGLAEVPLDQPAFG